MKAFYACILFVGLTMITVMQLVDYALPVDAFVASTLSRNPDAWTISVTETLETQLDRIDVKAQVVHALKNRASFRTNMYAESFREGAALVVLSLIGLVREGKINTMRKTLEPGSQ